MGVFAPFLNCKNGTKSQIASQIRIPKEYLFIAASLDCLATCKCCGNDLLEVKYSHYIRHEKPAVQNLGYLEFDEDVNIHSILFVTKNIA